MRNRPPPGEVVLALFFGVLGILWVVAALRMPLWSGFVPQSGFMPLWYGVLLTALSGAILGTRFLRTEPSQVEEPVRKPLVVLAVFAASIAGLDLLGFAASVFLLLLVLFTVVERLPLARSILVAAGTTTLLYLVFRTWLGVTLPAGPLGI
jgi:hypothetical protein